MSNNFYRKAIVCGLAAALAFGVVGDEIEIENGNLKIENKVQKFSLTGKQDIEVSSALSDSSIMSPLSTVSTGGTPMLPSTHYASRTTQYAVRYTQYALSIAQNPFKYSGYYSDTESGLCYLKARYYSPLFMLFISRDTYDLPNRYAYCDGNPVNSTDPEGHAPGCFGSGVRTFFRNLREKISSCCRSQSRKEGRTLADVARKENATAKGRRGGNTECKKKADDDDGDLYCSVFEPRNKQQRPPALPKSRLVVSTGSVGSESKAVKNIVPGNPDLDYQPGHPCAVPDDSGPPPPILFPGAPPKQNPLSEGMKSALEKIGVVCCTDSLVEPLYTAYVENGTIKRPSSYYYR